MKKLFDNNDKINNAYLNRNIILSPKNLSK